MDVGRLTARLDAVLDDHAFDRFDKRLDSARREAKRDVVAQLRGDAETRQFDKFGKELDKAQREAHKGAKAKLDADVDTRGFDKYNRALKDTDHEHGNLVRGSAKVKSGMGSLFFGGAGIAAGAGAFYGLAKAAKFVTSEFGESQKVATQTNAVLKSTGGVANVSAKEVDSLATSISKKTGIDDEAVASGENLLLTFTNVRNEAGKGNDIFNQTTKLAADMSTALGIDLSAANMQLGKALNDPEKGMTRLQRSGVSFTEAQKKQVAALQESGDTLGAQKIILGEVQKEFGGSAEAAGKTLPGALNRMKVAVGNVAEEIGGKLSPYVVKAADFIEKLASGGLKGGKGLDTLKSAARGVGDVFRAVFGFVGDVIADNRKSIDRFGSTIKTNFNAVIGAVKQIGHAFKGTFGGSTGFGNDLRTIIKVVMSFYSIVYSVMSNVARRALPLVVNAFKAFALVLRGVIRIISGILHGDFSKVWAGVKDIFNGGIKSVVNMLRLMTAPIRAALSLIGRVIGSATRGFLRFFRDLPGDIWGQLKRALSFVARFARDLVSDGANAAKKFVKRVVDFVRDLPGDVWNALKSVIVRVGRWEREMVERAVSTGKRFVSRVIDFVSDLPGKIWDKFVSTLDRVGDFERKIGAKAADIGRSVVSRIISGVREMPGKVMGFFGDLLGRMRNIPSRMAGIFRDIGSKMGNAIRGAANKLIPDHIRINLPDKLPGLPDAITINIPQLAEGGKVGPGHGGFRAFIAGEGQLPEWVISQEGDRRKNISWAKEALESLTGRAVALHAMGSGPGTRAYGEARGDMPGIVKQEKKIAQMQRELGQKEQKFDQSTEVPIVETADGMQILDTDAINTRASELEQLRNDQEAVRNEIAYLYQLVRIALDSWKTALKRLRAQLRRSKKKYKEGLKEAIGVAEETIPALEDQAVQVGGSVNANVQAPGGGDWLDAELQRQGYDQERNEILGTPKPAAPATDPPPRFGGTYLSDAEDAELGNLLEASATAGTTADTGDDLSTAAGLRSFYQRRLGRGGLSQAERIELLGLIGAEPEAPTPPPTPGTPPTSDTPTPPSPIEIAAAALAAVDQFQSQRGDLFGQFGSNFVRNGGISDATGAAAGFRFFGAAQSGGSLAQAVGGGVNIQQYFDAPPNDPHVWTRNLDFELRAAI